MALDQLSANDKVRLTQYIDGGLKVLQEIADLRDGLKDTTKALAEEFDVKPAVLNKALRAAFKDGIAADREKLDEVEAILVATGRG